MHTTVDTELVKINGYIAVSKILFKKLYSSTFSYLSYFVIETVSIAILIIIVYCEP